jgi:hypothetical protein
MQFSSKEDIEAPIDGVFREITDFQSFERSALRRGAEVQRTDALGAPAVGMSWHARFMLRGRKREMDIELVEYDPPNGIGLEARSPAILGRMRVDLVALSRGRTRLSVDLVLEPRSISGRLMVQSLKLARANLTKRFRLRVADYAVDLEERFKRNV